MNSLVKQGRALIIYGPRQIGKTTILRKYLASTSEKYKLDTGERSLVRESLGGDYDDAVEYARGYDIVAVDEAQMIDNVGAGLKAIVDALPAVKLIATGSSSFDLARSVGEPLVGRKRTIRLYPIAQMELLGSVYNAFELKERLEEFLLYGSYPEVVKAETRSDKVDYLYELIDSYLLKDILGVDGLRSPKFLMDLLRLLAFQVGNEVSLSELASKLGRDVRTVERYLDLLEQCFIIVRVGGFSRNMRNEVSKKSKYYFVDTGVRNAVIRQFNSLDLRDDVGALWENFLFMERLKYNEYSGTHAMTYFWRVYSGQEVDFVEECDGRLYGYEAKWSTKRNVVPPRVWHEAYPEASFEVVTPENYLHFVTGV